MPRPIGTRATLFDYNRLMYVRGNPLRFNDPTGHGCNIPIAPVLMLMAQDCAGGAGIGIAIAATQAALQVAPHADKIDVMADQASDYIVRLTDQTAHHSGQQGGDNEGNSGTGDPGGLDPNNFDPNKNKDLVKELGKVIKRYPLDSGKCEKCATTTYNILKNAGYSAEKVRLEYGPEVTERFMFAADGTTISYTRGVTRAFHEFVRVGNRVFDSMTGPEGMLWDDYVKLWDPETLKLVTEIVVK